MIGEYLGDASVHTPLIWSRANHPLCTSSDDENIATMHAFVDQLDFKDLSFLDALRIFLQAFRLPGESQKIDRFMLKFAERYIAGNTQTPFANAGKFL